MVQGLIKALKPERELLLTATPSSFIKENHTAPSPRPLHFISTEEVYLEGLAQGHSTMSVPDYYIVESTYTWCDSDRTGTHELKPTWVAETQFTQTSLSRLIQQMLFTLGHLNHEAAWSDAFYAKGKTLIVCKNRKQARDVHSALLAHMVNAALTECQTDVPAKLLKQFRIDPALTVLVVVERATLGFNMPSLRNLLDMSGSRNPDTVYQMLGRVLRVDRDHPQAVKSFFRLAPADAIDEERRFMQFVLAMNRLEVISRFTGDNFRELKFEMQQDLAPIPHKGQMKRGVVKPSEVTPCYNTFTDEDEKQFQFFQSVPYWASNKDFGIRYKASLKDVMRASGGYYCEATDWVIRFEQCKDFHATHGKLPSCKAVNSDERRLGQWLSMSCCKSNRLTFHPEVYAWASSFRKKIKPWEARFIECKEFFAKHGKLPSMTSKDPYERRLGEWRNNACSKSGDIFHPEVREWVTQVSSVSFDSIKGKKWEEKWDKCKTFYANNGRLPSRYRKDVPAEEEELGRWIEHVSSPSAKAHRPEVKEWRDSIRPVNTGAARPWQQNFSACKLFYATYGCPPTKHGTYPESKRLALWLEKYCYSRRFTPEVREWLDQIHAQEKTKVKAVTPRPDTESA